MNEQFFYVQFRLRVKRTGTQPVPQDPEVMLEVPRRLVEDWKRENPSPVNSDEAIAADIARVVAVKTAFPYKSYPEHQCDTPNWYQRRPPLMNERACDYHDNGIRAWLVK
jgi:hypothetical protein